MNKPKVVLVGPEAREKLIKGANLLADAVKSTLGPYGMNAVSGLQGQVKITNDGVTIANDICSEDEIENLGIRTLRESAQKTNEEAGDGTTSATTIAQAILRIADEYLPKKGEYKGKMSAAALAKKIIKEADEVSELLVGTPVKSKEDLINAARVAVEDESLAKIIGETQWELGPEGTILAEESNDKTDSVERIRGVRIDNGFGTSLMLNNLEKQMLEVTSVRVILTNHTMVGSEFIKLDQILKRLAEKGETKVVIIARAFANEVIQACMNSCNRGFFLYPVNAPYVDQTQVMMDIAAVTGAGFINSEEKPLDRIILGDVGFAERISSTRFSTIIAGKAGDALLDTKVAKRIEELKANFKGSESSFEKKGIEVRISQLENGFALLKVGGNSLVERKYKKDKVDDCVNATKSALKFGTVKGGGLALKEIADSLNDTYILRDALRAPYEQIQANAGEAFEIPDWCRDPVHVVKTALIKAASVSAQLATASIAYDWANDKPRYVQETKQEE